MSTYHDGRHALAGIARAEERVAFALCEGPAFLELIRVEGCLVIRSWDMTTDDAPPAILGSAWNRGHMARMWRRLSGDEQTAYCLIKGYL